MKPDTVLPFLFIGIAVVLGVAFLVTGVVRARHGHRWLPASGVVVDQRVPGSDGGATGARPSYPIVDFTTREGQQVRGFEAVGTDPPRYRVGEHVQLRYNPDDPTNIIVGSGRFAGLGFIAIGVLMLGAVIAGAVITALK